MKFGIKQKLYGVVIFLVFLSAAVGVPAFLVGRPLSEGGAVDLQTRALRASINADMMHDAVRADVYASFFYAKNEEQKKTVLADLKEHADTFTEQYNVLLTPEVAAVVNPDPALKEKITGYVASANAVIEAAAVSHEAGEAKLPEYLAAFSVLEESLDQMGDKIEGISATSRAGERTY